MKEKELIKQCQRGDREAFDALIRLFYPYVSQLPVKNDPGPDLGVGFNPGDDPV